MSTFGAPRLTMAHPEIAPRPWRVEVPIIGGLHRRGWCLILDRDGGVVAMMMEEANARAIVAAVNAAFTP